LGNLPNIGGYSPTVTLVLLDASGNLTTTPSDVQGYEYTIVLNRYRPTTSLPYSRSTALVAGTVAKSLTVTRISSHSPPLAGTFSILVNNVPLQIDNGNVNIPYNFHTNTIAYYLNKLYNTD
jgi:hypothetical protein